MAYRYVSQPVTLDNFVEAFRDLEKSAGKKLRLIGGCLMEDNAPYRMVLLNTNGSDWESYGGDIDGIFIE